MAFVSNRLRIIKVNENIWNTRKDLPLVLVHFHWVKFHLSPVLEERICHRLFPQSALYCRSWFSLVVLAFMFPFHGWALCLCIAEAWHTKRRALLRLSTIRYPEVSAVYFPIKLKWRYWVPSNFSKLSSI